MVEIAHGNKFAFCTYIIFNNKVFNNNYLELNVLNLSHLLPPSITNLI